MTMSTTRAIRIAAIVILAFPLAQSVAFSRVRIVDGDTWCRSLINSAWSAKASAAPTQPDCVGSNRPRCRSTDVWPIWDADAFGTKPGRHLPEALGFRRKSDDLYSRKPAKTLHKLDRCGNGVGRLSAQLVGADERPFQMHPKDFCFVIALLFHCPGHGEERVLYLGQWRRHCGDKKTRCAVGGMGARDLMCSFSSFHSVGSPAAMAGKVDEPRYQEQAVFGFSERFDRRHQQSP